MKWIEDTKKKSTITFRELRAMLSPEEFTELYKWAIKREGPKGERMYSYDFQQWLDWKRHNGPEPE